MTEDLIVFQKNYIFILLKSEYMKEIKIVKSISDYNNILGLETKHPLICVVDFSTLTKPAKREALALSFGFYAIFLKEDNNCIIKYGRNRYDYQSGSLVFIAPNQIVSLEDDGEDYEPSGLALLFHPDLLHRTTLAQGIKEFSFFAYSVSEALHLSEAEKQIVLDSFKKVNCEISSQIDKHSKQLITANIELFLKYCLRFYDRQFITRDSLIAGTIEKLDNLLHKYYESKNPELIGTPSVAYCANELNLSPNYFGDLVKKETGKSAQEYIHEYTINLAKEKIFDLNKSITQISFELGFKYPHHFTRLFKQKVGVTPNEFRFVKNIEITPLIKAKN